MSGQIPKASHQTKRTGFSDLPPSATGLAACPGTADAVDFDEDTVLDAVGEELTESTVEAFSIEGGDGGIVRYVVSTLSPEGGRLDVTVASDGTVLAVDPL